MQTDPSEQPLIEELSEKQREVLDLIVDRRTNKEIAVILGISASAVEQRLQSVRRRLGVTSRSDLARTYESLLAACQNQTGEKLQVVGNSHPVQTYTETAEVLIAEESGDPGVTLNQVRQPRNVRDAKPIVERSQGGIRLVRWVDHVAGLPGRIAAITVTAASLAFLLTLMVRLREIQ